MSDLKAPNKPARRGANAPAPQTLPDRPGRLKLLLRRRRASVRPLLIAGVLLGGLAASFVVAQGIGKGASLTDRLADSAARLGFRVQTITVLGQQKTPDTHITTALGLRVGDPILNFSVGSARRRLEAVPWVEAATVERRLPNTVLVTLTERRPFAVWQHDGRFALIDRDGSLVTDSDVAAFAGQLPLVVGTGAPAAAAALLDELEQQPDLKARVIAAVRVGERRWNLRMTNGADVMLPEGAEHAALARLAQLQASHGLLDRPLAVLDMRLADRLVVRPQAERPAQPNTPHGPPAPAPGSAPARKT